MPSKIICNVLSRETRVALLENGVITELYIERGDDQGLVGNIYKGVVTKVLPGMQVAFVDIGGPKAGFLYVSDVDQSSNGSTNVLDAVGKAHGDDDLEFASHQRGQDQHRPIEELLHEGQELMVQVSKNPIGSKGPRITTYITIPGRYLVFMPSVEQVGVSRRIEDEVEKKRLRDIVLSLKNNGSGYIVRTAADGMEEQELSHDIDFLNKLWGSITNESDTTSSPSLIYNELNLVQRSMRDLFTRDFTKVIIDDDEEHVRSLSFCRSYLPDITKRIELYDGAEPIFDAYGLEIEIERALGRKVWLKSGGYIVIDQTEALTAIDVNTGKFVGSVSQEETVLKTNLEAVKEIVYQLRLRNIGGLIIIDFIDMEKDTSKEKVYSSLSKAITADRSRANILKISELGLVEMTRKRVRESLSRTLTTPCHYCDGKGVIKSPATVLYEVYRQIKRVAHAIGSSRLVVCNVSPAVANLMFDEDSDYLDSLERDLNIKIAINTDFSLHQERFTVEPG